MSNRNSEKLSKLTIASYAMSYGSGYQIMGSLVGAYLMVFLTDTFGIPAGAVGVIMVLASIWDAINDPIMGVIADKTKTKYGKYRPYFLFVPALLENLRWPSTLSMPKAAAAMWRACRPTPANSWAGSESPRPTKSPACRRRLPLSRRSTPATRAQQLALQRRFMTTCACCSDAWAIRSRP